MKFLVAASLVFLLGFTACADKHASYQYRFMLTGTGACDTGEQTFSSLEAMCTALESASLNDSCDLSARQAFFSQNACPGVFQETP